MFAYLEETFFEAIRENKQEEVTNKYAVSISFCSMFRKSKRGWFIFIFCKRDIKS